MVWLLCRRCANVEEMRSRDFVVVGRVFVMASVELAGSSPPALFEDYDIMDLKMQLEQLKRMVDTIETEGGRCLENVDRNLVFLRKEFK